MKRNAYVFATACLVGLAGALAGCSSEETANADGEQVIRVGTQNDYPPFAFADDANQLTGYDVDMMKAVD